MSRIRRIEFENDSVDAAKTIKAEDASVTELIIAKPAALTGRLAGDHWTSSRSIQNL